MGGEGRGEGREGREKKKGRGNLLQGVRGIDAPGFTCTPRRSIRNQNEPCTCLCLPGYGRYSFTDPEGWKAELACARARLLYEPYSRHKRQSAPFFSVLLLTSPLSSPSSADATNVNHADGISRSTHHSCRLITPHITPLSYYNLRCRALRVIGSQC